MRNITYYTGGSKILLAAGKGLEAFFNVYAVHKADHVMEIMETLRIGNVHIDDMKEVIAQSVCPLPSQTPDTDTELTWSHDLW